MGATSSVNNSVSMSPIKHSQMPPAIKVRRGSPSRAVPVLLPRQRGRRGPRGQRNAHALRRLAPTAGSARHEPHRLEGESQIRRRRYRRRRGQGGRLARDAHAAAVEGGLALHRVSERAPHGGDAGGVQGVRTSPTPQVVRRGARRQREKPTHFARGQPPQAPQLDVSVRTTSLADPASSPHAPFFLGAPPHFLRAPFPRRRRAGGARPSPGPKVRARRQSYVCAPGAEPCRGRGGPGARLVWSGRGARLLALAARR